uniref:Uncharacterized protein n=1 Tax=Glossina palpalis gambiensis TaxID=67801 RepID=A0A1B0ALL4_9MUSC
IQENLYFLGPLPLVSLLLDARSSVGLFLRSTNFLFLLMERKIPDTPTSHMVPMLDISHDKVLIFLRTQFSVSRVGNFNDKAMMTNKITGVESVLYKLQSNLHIFKIFHYATIVERCLIFLAIILASLFAVIILSCSATYDEIASLVVYHTVGVGTSSGTFFLPVFGVRSKSGKPR